MVIHDMRNPAISIDLALQEVIKILQLDKKKHMRKRSIEPNEIKVDGIFSLDVSAPD